MRPTLKLFTRFPTPGKAKTRLIPAIGAERAARVHRVLTERTLNVLLASDCPVEVHFTGADVVRFRHWLGTAATLVAQIDAGLGERLTAALGRGPGLFFGADTPGLTMRHVAAAVAALDDHDVAIGPAEDGGYWVIGIAVPRPELFDGIDWSTDRVFAQTMAKAEGSSVATLDTLADCDRPEDLTRWPWLTA